MESMVASNDRDHARRPLLDRRRLLGFRPLAALASETTAENLELLHNKVGEPPPPPAPSSPWRTP